MKFQQALLLGTVVAAAEHQLTYKERLAQAQIDARNMLEIFMYDHGLDTMVNDGVEKTQKYAEEHHLKQKMACASDVSAASAKLSEYLMLVGEGTPMSVTAGVTGVGEVFYALPKDLYHCFSSKEKYEQFNGSWSTVLHKEEMQTFLQSQTAKYLPQDFDYNWKHHLSQKYVNGIEATAETISDNIHYVGKEAQAYWDVVKGAVYSKTPTQTEDL